MCNMLPRGLSAPPDSPSTHSLPSLYPVLQVDTTTPVKLEHTTPLEEVDTTPTLITGVDTRPTVQEVGGGTIRIIHTGVGLPPNR